MPPADPPLLEAQLGGVGVQRGLCAATGRESDRANNAPQLKLSRDVFMMDFGVKTMWRHPGKKLAATGAIGVYDMQCKTIQVR